MRITFLLFALLTCINLYAQSPLVFSRFDLNTGSGNSNPMLFAMCNNQIVFRATDANNGTEPWVSDGTMTGTKTLKDIIPGAFSSVPEYFYKFNGKLCFNATDSAHGKELWITDGTTTGTTLLKDLTPGTFYGGMYSGGIELGNNFIFSGSDRELWISDGTTSGTQLLKDIYPGSQQSVPAGFCQMKGKVYFSASSQNTSRELWQTDGTNQGTVIVKNITPGITGSIFSIGDTLYFRASVPGVGIEWWISSGSAINTIMLKEINVGTGNGANDNEIILYNGKIYFAANNGSSGIELWVTNGTETGTYMVRDINAGALSSNPKGFTVCNDRLYFTATDSITGTELWLTDGTDTGTHIVHDILTGTGSSNPAYLIPYKDFLYFTARQAIGDVQLFRTNGTVAGTTVVAPAGATNINPLASTNAFIIKDSTLYFAANYDSIGNELWSIKDTTKKQIPGSINNAHAGISFSIYPNPNDGNFIIQPASTNFKAGSVKVFDVAGRIVYTQEIPPNTMSINMQLKNVTKGVYIVQLKLDNDLSFQQLVVQ